MQRINEYLREKERKIGLKMNSKFTKMQADFNKAMGRNQGNCWKQFSTNRKGFMQCMLDNDDKFQKFQKRFELTHKFHTNHKLKCMEDAFKHSEGDVVMQEKNFDKCFRKYSRRLGKSI